MQWCGQVAAGIPDGNADMRARVCSHVIRVNVMVKQDVIYLNVCHCKSFGDLCSEVPLDEEAVKAQAREHNLAAAREAEARKQRRLKDKERKKNAVEAKVKPAVRLHTFMPFLCVSRAAL